MKKTNLFIVGEPKSGTSAFYAFLQQHPDIFMSIEKEPCFFCKDIHKESTDFYGKNLFFHHTDVHSYHQLFAAANNENVRGEASTLYLYSQTSAEEIHAYNPDAKIIMMFRDPVSFMHSLHSQYLSEMTEDEADFSKALALEGVRKEHQKGTIPSGARSPSFLFYRKRTRYYEHIHRFLDIFPKNQIKVILFEDFVSNNDKIFKDVLEFLNVDPNFKPGYGDVNTNKTVRYKTFYRFIQSPKIKLFFWKILSPKFYYKCKKVFERLFFKYEKRAQLDAVLKEDLKKEFKPAVVELNEFLNRENFIAQDLLALWGYN